MATSRARLRDNVACTMNAMVGMPPQACQFRNCRRPPAGQLRIGCLPAHDGHHDVMISAAQHHRSAGPERGDTLLRLTSTR